MLPVTSQISCEEPKSMQLKYLSSSLAAPLFVTKLECGVKEGSCSLGGTWLAVHGLGLGLREACSAVPGGMLPQVPSSARFCKPGGAS